MKKTPILTYVFPFILLLIAVVILKGSTLQKDDKTDEIESPQDIERPVLVITTPTEDNSEGDESVTESKIQSRIPIYPNSKKIALGKGVDIDEATFHSTTDSIDEVKAWYIDYLGGLTKVNMIDIVGRDDIRKVTLSMPDKPNELVEIKPQFKDSKDLIITITTIKFYTRAQPRSYEPKDADPLVGESLEGESVSSDSTEGN